MFVQTRTFVYLLASYDWFFEHGDDLDNQFNDGRLNWSVGVGYQF